MSSQKDHEFKENLEKCYSIVQQSSVKGISAAEVSKRLGKHRTTVHGYLNTLEYMGKVESQHGTWHTRTGEQTIKPLEKEIVIELPIPRKLYPQLALLEAHAKFCEEYGHTNQVERIMLEKFNETRTIRIKGKNVEDIDLQKLGDLIQQASESSSKFNFKGLFKTLKIPRTNSKKETTEDTKG